MAALNWSLRLAHGLLAQCAVPTLLTALGIAGLVTDGSGWRPSLPFDLPALFGAVLVASAGLRFQAQMRHSRHTSPDEIRAASRRGSRQVYLVLGLLVLFDKLHYLAGNDQDAHAGILRAYFLYALTALVAIRLAAMVSCYRGRLRSGGVR